MKMEKDAIDAGENGGYNVSVNPRAEKTPDCIQSGVSMSVIIRFRSSTQEFVHCI